MSTPQTETRKTVNGPNAPTQATAPSAPAVKDRFRKIETDRFMYNANKGCTKPLVGYLLNLVPMPPIARGKDKQGNLITQDWDSFLSKTTEPTLALDREKKLVDVPVGSEVLVPATFQLSQHFTKVSSHAELCFEVYIEPKKKIDVGAGQTMWIYDLGANTSNAKKRMEFGAASMLGSPVQHVLPPRGQSTAEDAGSGQNESDEIPF
jgi:hypothetical protein